MKNIHQLSKLSRRLPRLVTRCAKKLQKKLPQGVAAEYMRKLYGANVARNLLVEEIKARNIGGEPYWKKVGQRNPDKRAEFRQRLLHTIGVQQMAKALETV